MITKTIHYCWFGRGELPEKAKQCIESWKKFCPDYEIKEWNEDNFDMNSCAYVKEAYEAKKWAFVSDYARFEILYKYGGLYFDTDVELVKSFDDIVSKGTFMGLQPGKKTVHGMEYEVNPGLGLGSEPGVEVFKEIIEFYHQLHFVTGNGGQNIKTIVDYTTEILKKHGMVNANIIQQVAGITVYPADFFCPLDFNTGVLTTTENTHSIHHFVASWFTPLDWAILKIERKFGNGGKGRYLLGQRNVEGHLLYNMILNDGRILGSVCNKFYRAESIRNFSFLTELEYCEDLVFNAKLVEKNNLKAVIVGYPIYHYIINEESATNNKDRLFTNDSRLKYIVALERLLGEASDRKYKDFTEYKIVTLALDFLFHDYVDGERKSNLKEAVRMFRQF